MAANTNTFGERKSPIKDIKKLIWTWITDMEGSRHLDMEFLEV